MYSFEKHQRLDTTIPVYSPHVLVLEGIFALYDKRVLDLLDLKIFAEADPDLCLARRSMSKIFIHQTHFVTLMLRQSKLSVMLKRGEEIWKDVSNNGFRL